MQSLTPNQWESAKSDAEILEQKIAALVDEFEQKHKPVQVNVVTRWRDIGDLYQIEKGGAAQIYIREVPQEGGQIAILDSAMNSDLVEIIYSDRK